MSRFKPMKDALGAHARLYEQITRSPAWLALSVTSRAFYMDMRIQLKGTNNGNISAPHSMMKALGYKAPATVAKAQRELETMGLIAKTRQGGITAGGKSCNLFRFTDQPCSEFLKLGILPCNATHDWRAWRCVDAARAAIEKAHVMVKRPSSEKCTQASETEADQFSD